MRIRIGLPLNRDYAGRLEVLDANDAIVFGPVPAAGRSHDELAAGHGNASRSPLRPYGDTPLGTYAVRGIVESGAETALDGGEFGSHGVVLLEPRSGQAALADAHGRLRLLIQGGTEDEGALRATAGSVRLHDADLKQLVALIRAESGRVLCEVSPLAECGAKLSLARPYPRDRDPPTLPGRLYGSMPATPVRASSAKARAGSFAPRMFVMPERSGSSDATHYGASDTGTDQSFDTGTDTGITDAGLSNQTLVSPLPPSGVDVAPMPGADLNPPPDQTGVILNQSGGSQLLSTSPPTGLSSPYPLEDGWLPTAPGGNPYAPAITDDGDLLAPYVGANAATYSGAPPDGEQNSYLGGPPADSFSGDPTSDPFRGPGKTIDTSGYLAMAGNNIVAPPPAADDETYANALLGAGAAPPTDSPGVTPSGQPDATAAGDTGDGGAPTPTAPIQGTYTSYYPQRDTIANPDAAIQEMVTRFAQYDPDLDTPAGQWVQQNPNVPAQGPATARGVGGSPGGGQPSATGGGSSGASPGPWITPTRENMDWFARYFDLVDQLRANWSSGNAFETGIFDTFLKPEGVQKNTFTVPSTTSSGEAYNGIPDIYKDIPGQPVGDIKNWRYLWNTPQLQAQANIAERLSEGMPGELASSFSVITGQRNWGISQSLIDSVYNPPPGSLRQGGFIFNASPSNAAVAEVLDPSTRSWVPFLGGSWGMEPGGTPPALPPQSAPLNLATVGSVALSAAGAAYSGYSFYQDLSQGNWLNASLSGSAFAGSSFTAAGTALGYEGASLTALGTVLVAPSAVVGAAGAGVAAGNYIANTTASPDTAAAAGASVDKATAAAAAWINTVTNTPSQAPSGYGPTTGGEIGAALAAIGTAPWYAAQGVANASADTGTWLGDAAYNAVQYLESLPSALEGALQQARRYAAPWR